MTSRRRILEWPRLIAALVVLAIVLVLAGVVVASASSGNGQAGQITRLRQTDAAHLATLRSEQLTVAQLRAKLSAAEAKLHASAVSRRALVASRRQTACWKAKARHPRRVHVRACLAGR